MNRWFTLAAFVIWTAVAAWVGWEWRDRGADLAAIQQQAAAAQGEAATQAEARATEHQQAETLAAIGMKHEEDRKAATAVPAAVVAELRAGNLRLRNEWAGCETQRLSDTAAGSVERDALAASRDKLAGAVIRVGRDADDQLRACQAVIAADRAQVVPVGQ